MRHDIDIDGPSVAINSVQGDVVNTGLQLITGEANDGSGTGVEFVEVSINGAAFETVTGTIGWSTEVDVSGAQSSVNIQARATDYHGQVGPTVSQTFYVDTVPPNFLSLAVPALVGGRNSVQLTGIVADPNPDPASLSAVDTVEIQIGDESGAWEEVNDLLYINFIGDDQIFFYTWQLPAADGEANQVRFRATDFAGNQTISDWQQTVVDNVAPDIEVTGYFDTVSTSTPLPALIGTISDGSTVDTIDITIYPDGGATLTDTVDVTSSDWSYTLDQPLGQYDLFLSAVDAAGNERLIGPYAVEVVAESLSADLTGSLTFIGRDTPPNAQWSVPVTVSLHAVGVVTPTYTFTPTTDQNGQFSVTNIQPGLYEIAVKTDFGLQLVQQETLNDGTNSVDFGTIAGGDANGDNEVTLIDFSILSSSFNLAEGDPGYDPRADFNGDGEVTALDFSILATNFNLSGEEVGD
ncbi:MAG: dockerin type I domain-containing protein [Chloroflexota bacterium]